MHIVIADNSRSILEMISKQVTERGNTVTTFQDGQDVYDYLSACRPFDILLTSLELKNISGLELCWAANACADSVSSKYSIVMSSSSDVDTLVEALDSGADDFLKKPFLQQELNARLRAAERTVTAQNELLRLASKDALLNISNRRDFFNRVDGKLIEASANKQSSLILLEMDNLASINEEYGHKAGDALLIALKQVVDIKNMIFGRLGGSEFGVFLDKVSIDKAEIIAEAIREKIAKIAIPFNDNTLRAIVNIGVAPLQSYKDITSAMKKAHQALQAAKNLGRNQAVIWGSILHQSSVEQISSVQGFDHFNDKVHSISPALKLTSF